jgi:hypothetical protein
MGDEFVDIRTHQRLSPIEDKEASTCFSNLGDYSLRLLCVQLLGVGGILGIAVAVLAP